MHRILFITQNFLFVCYTWGILKCFEIQKASRIVCSWKRYWACTQREVYSDFSTLGCCFLLWLMFPLESLVLIFFFLKNLGYFQLSALKAFSFLKLSILGFKNQGELYAAWQQINILTVVNLFFFLGCPYHRTHKYREIESQGTNYVFWRSTSIRRWTSWSWSIKFECKNSE